MDGIVDVQAWCDHPLAWGGWGFAGLVLIVVGAVTWFVVLVVRERRSGAGRHRRSRVAAVLREEYAHGEVSAEGFRRVHEALRRS